jgi:tRNA(fMet)-specific endonuclease VapC
MYQHYRGSGVTLRSCEKDSSQLTAQLDAVLGALQVLPFEALADAAYGSLRSRRERAGTPIGGNNLLIAAQAISLGCILVTDNKKEFARVKHLNWENWLR